MYGEFSIVADDNARLLHLRHVLIHNRVQYGATVGLSKPCLAVMECSNYIAPLLLFDRISDTETESRKAFETMESDEAVS